MARHGARRDREPSGIGTAPLDPGLTADADAGSR
ncbi:hypothetical protein DFP74_3497 [Nocardiopsis sp. Huas11]|nr:hypothetical protein DFP74_3497 [Nocardiopsis sp. Huas11]